MHILLIHQYFLEKNDGGGSRFNEMTRHWATQGHTVTVLAGMVHYNTGKKEARYKGKMFFQETFSPGVEVLRCHVSESYNAGFAGRMWGYFSFVFSGLLGALLKLHGKYDVIAVTSPPLFVGAIGYVLKRIFMAPMLFEIRDLWPESAIDTGVLTSKALIKMAYAFEAFMYKKADRINVLTPAFKTSLITKKGVSESKISFIPNAADFSLSDQLIDNFDRENFREEAGWKGKFVALYVGAHGVANHLIQVIEAAEYLRDSNVILVLIGAGMEREMLLQEVANRSLKNVVMLPPVSKERIFEYIYSCDVGLSVLKKVDTFKTVYSNKTFDYMACQRPIIMCIDGVSRELVETAQCGIYSEPENPKQLADTLLYLSKNKDLANQMGLAGYRYAKAHFDREVLANQYLAELKKLVN